MQEIFSLTEAINMRHSVRAYIDRPLPEPLVQTFRDRLDDLNYQSNLHIQLLIDEPNAFSGRLARHGSFKNVKNYFALVGKKSDEYLDQKAGYYGQNLVLYAQQLGLNTCWVGSNFNRRKSAVALSKDERLVCVIALGYGITQGKPHKSKPLKQLYHCETHTPGWFKKAVQGASLAPTYRNQQKFMFFMVNQGGMEVEAKVWADAGHGPFTSVDLGIVKYHFEVAAKNANWSWANGPLTRSAPKLNTNPLSKEKRVRPQLKVRVIKPIFVEEPTPELEATPDVQESCDMEVVQLETLSEETAKAQEERESTERQISEDAPTQGDQSKIVALLKTHHLSALLLRSVREHSAGVGAVKNIDVNATVLTESTSQPNIILDPHISNEIAVSAMNTEAAALAGDGNLKKP